MKDIKTKKLIFTTCLLTTFLSLVIHCTRSTEDVLAVIGHRYIRVNDFITRYQASCQKTNLPDNLQVRNELFKNIVDEELLVFAAEQRGYHQDKAGKWEKERLKVQILLDLYLQSNVFNKIKIQETELKQLYVNLNTKIKARHLYTASRQQADSLYVVLKQGHSFDTIAKTIFHDPQLRDSGGSLGWFTVDEMDPAFENTAFALKIGEISHPVRTAQGYSIIQVQDRITKPLLTESEYIKHRDKLENYWRTRTQKTAAQAYVDSLRQELNIALNTPVVEKLWQFLKKNSRNTLIEKRHDFPVNAVLKNEELVRSTIGIWDVQTFQHYAQFTSETQHQWIQNRENLEGFIAGLVVRAWILARAEDLHLARSAVFKTTLQRKFDDYLLKRMEKSIEETVMIPQDSLEKHYRLHTDQFVIPPKIHLQEIVVNNNSNTAEIKYKLEQGQAFEKLAKEYSTRQWSAENGGNIGAFTYDELSQYADQLFPLQVNQWTGPIRMDSLLVFFKCIGKSPEQPLSFEQARPQIEKTLRPFWRRLARQTLLDSQRSQIDILAFPEKLKAIRLD